NVAGWNPSDLHSFPQNAQLDPTTAVFALARARWRHCARCADRAGKLKARQLAEVDDPRSKERRSAPHFSRVAVALSGDVPIVRWSAARPGWSPGSVGVNCAPIRLPSDHTAFAGRRWPLSSSITIWSPVATPNAPCSCTPPVEKSRIETVWKRP